MATSSVQKPSFTIVTITGIGTPSSSNFRFNSSGTITITTSNATKNGTTVATNISSVKANMTVVNAEYSNSSAVKGNWTITTDAAKIVIKGEMANDTKVTNLTLYLSTKDYSARSKIPTTAIKPDTVWKNFANQLFTDAAKARTGS